MLTKMLTALRGGEHLLASLPHGSPVDSMNPCSTKPMWRYTVRNDNFIVFVNQLIAVRLIQVHIWDRAKQVKAETYRETRGT